MKATELYPQNFDSHLSGLVDSYSHSWTPVKNPDPKESESANSGEK